FSSEYNSSGYRVVYMEHPDKCTGCAVCANVCPDVALEVYRQEPTKEAA
ncbi:MAG TPA: hypothetical protein ENF15_04200, partial [Candidatus Acetothermia bacterium]|nr:hypothetical protein [Candidatus Acetothermia bacterium]